MANTSLQIGNRTDPGRIHEENQDYLGYYSTRLGDLFLVCDGMGGPAGGRTASRLAVDQISRVFQNADEDANVKETIEAAVLVANKVVYETSQSDLSLRGMGTTCVIALIRDCVAYIGHVGDSRAYLVRDGTAMPLTRDHSLVQQLVEKGSVTQQEALKHPDREIITRAIGIEREVEVEVRPGGTRLRPGDQVILACDGLIISVGDDEIASIATQAESVQAACSELVDLANDRGGTDNVTVQIAKVVDSSRLNNRKGRSLAIVAAGLALLVVGGLLGHSLYNSSDDEIAEAIRARERGAFGEAYDLLSQSIEQNREDRQARGEMRHLADAAESHGLALYGKRDFEGAENTSGIAHKAYLDLTDEESARRTKSHVRKAILMSRAGLLDSEMRWTNTGGAVYVYTQVLEGDREDALAAEGLESIGDRLEIEGKNHEEGGRYAKAQSRYERAMEIWETLSRLAGDYTDRARQASLMIVECDKKLEASRRYSPGDVVLPTSANEQSQEVKFSASLPKVESSKVSESSPPGEAEVHLSSRELAEVVQGPVDTEPISEPGPTKDSGLTIDSTSARQEVAVKPVLMPNSSGDLQRTSKETDLRTGVGVPVLVDDSSRSPVYDEEVVSGDMRNAGGLLEEKYRPLQEWVMATLRDHLTIIKPDQTRHEPVEYSAIVYRRIDNDRIMTERSRDRAENLKKTGVDEGLWSAALAVKAWALSPDGTVADRMRILILVGKDYENVFLPLPRAKTSRKP